MDCDFAEYAPGKWMCSRCEFQVEAVSRPHKNCTALQLGDDLENWLTGLGITKERWSMVKQALGLPPTCNCPARKQWLNQASLKLQMGLEKLKNSLDEFYSKPR